MIARLQHARKIVMQASQRAEKYELLGKCDASMQRAVLTESEVAVADSFVKYAADTKKRHKAIDGAHNRCVQKGRDPSGSIADLWHVTKRALVAREESANKKQTKGNLMWIYRARLPSVRLVLRE